MDIGFVITFEFKQTHPNNKQCYKNLIGITNIQNGMRTNSLSLLSTYTRKHARTYIYTHTHTQT